MKDNDIHPTVFVIHKVYAFWERHNMSQHEQFNIVSKSLMTSLKSGDYSKNMARRSTTQNAREAKFCEKLDSLFDIAHADALNIITIPEDRNKRVHRPVATASS